MTMVGQWWEIHWKSHFKTFEKCNVQSLACCHICCLCFHVFAKCNNRNGQKKINLMKCVLSLHDKPQWHASMLWDHTFQKKKIRKAHGHSCGNRQLIWNKLWNKICCTKMIEKDVNESEKIWSMPKEIEILAMHAVCPECVRNCNKNNAMNFGSGIFCTFCLRLLLDENCQSSNQKLKLKMLKSEQTRKQLSTFGSLRNDPKAKFTIHSISDSDILLSIWNTEWQKCAQRAMEH